jgi:ubiquinone/menaquinone biosynthesis C-methylase UbiE
VQPSHAGNQLNRIGKQETPEQLHQFKVNFSARHEKMTIASSQDTSTEISREDLRRLLLQYRRENWAGIQPADVQAALVDQMLQDDGTIVLQQVQRCFQLPEHGLVLDVGSGVGTFVVGCRNRGIRAVGVEPDRIGQGGQLSSLRIARKRTAESIFVAGTGENLPFADQTFHLVTMNQVIEHVGDQNACLQEAVRVLKPGGALYIACPNYLRFYEPHYKIFWLPLMPKILGRAYLALRGRDPVMLPQLTYTTNARLRGFLRALGPDYTYVDLHEQQFLEKRNTRAFASRKFQWLARLTRISILGRILLRLVLFAIRTREGGCEMMVFKKS